jgi:multiple sugar transport system ATP-binding protein
MPPRDRDIAMVFQSYALYPTMSVADNIGFALEMRKVPKAEREKRIDEVAGCCRSSTCWTASPASSRAASASAWPWAGPWRATRKLFLFDEPLSNLDAKLRVEMRAEIKRLHQAAASPACTSRTTRSRR